MSTSTPQNPKSAPAGPSAILGELITLTHGAAQAEITTLGAHLRRLREGAREAIVGFGDDLPWGAHGAVLAPWPNRIEDGRYPWAGADLQLPINEIDRNNAIHGLLMWRTWQVEDRGPSSVRLRGDIDPSPGYPFPVSVWVTYTLRRDDAGTTTLDVDVRAENLGLDPAPFGIGFHPWLATGEGGLEQATLSVDATSWHATNERLLPTGEGPIPAELDFSTARPVGQTRLDDAFGGVTFDADGRSWVHLRGADGRTVSAWLSRPLQVWQLCTDPGPSPRPGVAAEPMSCIANAFRSGDDLHTLTRDEPFAAEWGLRLSAAS